MARSQAAGSGTLSSGRGRHRSLHPGPATVVTLSTGGPQVSEQNIAVVRRWFEEVWNQGRESSIDELFPADSVAHGLGDSEQDVHGPDEFKRFVANIRGALPDTHISVDDILANGDRVAVRVT